MSLRTYWSKRDFKKSPEPRGKKGRKKAAPIFVIQEHAARALHYDFRLEIDGVLKSWSVPKGPSTDPRDKRLAVPTEDHPMDYASFEGVIPEGYGAGTVLVWDNGTFQNLKEDVSMEEAYEQGRIEISLQGKKLRGGYALIRTGGRDPSGRDRWLLIKTRDEAADARRRPVSTERESVLSGRTLEEIKQEEGDPRLKRAANGRRR